jgi:hypothetical protein
MQHNAADGIKKNKKPSKQQYVELNETQSIELLAEIIANRIIEKIKYNDNNQPALEQLVTAGCKKREAA